MTQQRHYEGKAKVEKLLTTQAPRRTIEREEPLRIGHVGLTKKEVSHKMLYPIKQSISQGTSSQRRCHKQHEAMERIDTGYASHPKLTGTRATPPEAFVVTV